MGVACIYTGLVGIAKREHTGGKKLIYVSFADAIWMLYWAFGTTGDTSSGLLDLIKQFSH